ncbi:hypothetical protein G9A89_007052 [Geosiphon pyriformis]|nr:hypothetical protein G9A89_007052 [Geosiphon pyriformis]
MMCLSAEAVFKKKWFKGYDKIFSKDSSKFHKLELLVSKLVRASHMDSAEEFASLLNRWEGLNSVNASVVKSLFLLGSHFNTIWSVLSMVKKSYRASKMSEVERVRESQIRSAIDKRMESFELDKSHTIRNVLEHPFHKVTLDHLVVDDELVLEPALVKAKVDAVMERWTRKRNVVSDVTGVWNRQYQPLEYVFDDAFSGVMSLIDFDEMSNVISNLPDRKTAGLFSILNELWKHCDKSKEAWVSMIPKPYEWEGVLTNTRPIALVETARKILSKVLSNRISLACSVFDILREDNFSVLKGTTIQSPIFAIGSVIEDALEKNRELWLVLQDMRKTYNSVGWEHLRKSLIHDGLDQGEVFSPLFWCIFYDPLLCEVKRQESIYGYRLDSHFVVNTGRTESRTGLTSFLTAGVFVNDTIWIGSRQAATQHILNVATKKREPHRYLGIFLSTEGLSKPSLAKACLDVQFFTNLVLRKTISDKQFSYLVSAVLHPIIAYRTQFSFVPISVCMKWDAMILKGLKSKPGLPLNFLNDAIHYSFLYGLKSFEQVQAKSKSAAVGTPMSIVLGELAFYKYVSSLRQYGIVFVEQLHNRTGSVFKWRTFKRWKRLDLRSPIPDWFNAAVHFLSGSGSFPVCSFLPLNVDSSNVLESCKFNVVCNHLLEVDSDCLSLFMDGSLCGLGTLGMKAGTTVFFEDIDLGLGVEVSGLVSFTMMELQAIALALECVPPSRSVNLFSDSQAALDACRSELMLGCPNFRNHCWVKHCHISNVIRHKNLDVNWIKVRGHSGVLGNERVDTLARAAVSSGVHLPHRIDEHFLKAGGTVVFGNSRHFVHGVFYSIHHAYWEVSSGSRVLVDSLRADVDWFRSCSVWHPDSHLATGFTSAHTADSRTYFIKALHHRLSVAVRNVMCLFCGNVEISDYVFLCPFNAGDRARLMNAHASVWETCSGLSHSISCVSQSLSACISNAVVGAAIYKGFVFNEWYHESFSVFKNSKTAAQNIVTFVCDFCLAFRDDIWLVHAKHRAVMKKGGLIPRDGSISVSVSGLPSVLSSSVVRLLGIADAIDIGFGFRKSSLFFSGVGNLVSVYIGA